jgi:Na/Pi-cotransporter
MSGLNVFFAAVSAVLLFLYGLQGFSRELQTAGGTLLQAWLGRVTRNRWLAFVIGAFATALVQSSSAVSALTVALVESGVISFRSSLGVLLGANVGTTATAWLVSFKLTGIGPVFITLGALLSALPLRARIAGKPVFYFGLIFLALDLISNGLQPLQQKPAFQQWLSYATQPWLGVLMGAAFTALVQSSSVTSGLAILMVQQGILPPQSAIPLVVGANVGSTSTALIASIGMRPVARAAAVANQLFNASGALLFLPFLTPLSMALIALTGEPGTAVALAHLVFNLSIALVFLPALNTVGPLFLSRQIDS